MKTVSIFDIYLNKIKLNSKINIQGWVRNRRRSKLGLLFIDLYDGSCLYTMQVVVKDILSNYDSEISKLSVGCSINVFGVLISSIGTKQKYEIQAKVVKVIGIINNPGSYPISSKYHTMKHLRNVPHLRSRTNFFGAVSRVRNYLFNALHEFLFKNGYYWIPSPIITGLNSEGAGDMFKVSILDLNNIPKNKNGKINFKKDFFGKEAFLTVSGQLTLETYACSLSKVYSFGPIFRAENSNTRRHLSEFWMLEVETAFSNLCDIIKFSENMLKYAIGIILDKCVIDINFFRENVDEKIFCRLKDFSSKQFFQIEYKEAINILIKSNRFDHKVMFIGMELSSDHERFLVEEYFKFPLVITNYPKSLKAFYMRVNDDNKTVSAMDVLVPGVGEIIGGSEREERLNVLDRRFFELNLNKEDYWWYRDLRKYGTIPHSGFGLGFERLLSYILGIKNIRDVCPFPRTAYKADF
ncbi:asparaginyl-tRNA synthetase [Buchnera aphidicola str. Bp (Baizongia pistaciae)]|uniref:Asparagine--tRNA ligase n=1 Tax=Buchnera aphidicola subsp. Baizongia pistaciae (strain Bp) TaxID=224915 RepID=SYN_BUCBP|nr:asparagine--tRNA ligase [Buchnera aphidicola]P59517.1 RecName: Full=Asparagine--tRNA ligase; AltName: Full=Asparaginyl-tRNA synthetase; Short=AsnRS [Buchnera aphidicola str. Bp (Baizongia pistaciae)]AAO27050.1 asparaginyl-tRNA synthetase [Buchnera aphidicola str. Bp (Baizongia pistaciae)]